MNRQTLLGLASGLSATAIWGGLYAVSKAAMESVPPFTLLSLRILLGILTLWLFMRWRGQLRWPPRQAWWQIFWVGFIGYGVSISFQFVGTHLSTASNGALVTSATPAFVTLFAAWLLGERITGRRLLALTLATLGVFAVIDPRAARMDATILRGNIFLLIAALTWALHSTLIRKVTRKTDVLNVSLIAFFGGLPVYLPMSLYEIQQGRVHLSAFTPGIIGGVLFLGIISTAIAMYLWNNAFALLDAGVAALTFFAQPVIGTLLGILFLDEKITPLFVLGGLLIGAGILLVSREPGEKKGDADLPLGVP